MLRELNISLDRAVDFLGTKGFDIEPRPTTKITTEVYNILFEEFQKDRSKKVASIEVSEEKRKEKEEIRQAQVEESEKKKKTEDTIIKAKGHVEKPKTLGKIELKPKTPAKEEVKEEEKKEEPKQAKSSNQEEKPQEAKVESTEKEESPSVISNRPSKIQIKPKQKIDLDNLNPKKPVNKKPESRHQQNQGEKNTRPKKEHKPKPVSNTESQKVNKENTSRNKPKVKPAEGENKKVSKEAEMEKLKATSERIETKYQKLEGPKLVGEKIDLNKFKKPEKKKDTQGGNQAARKKKRKRINKPGGKPGQGQNPNNRNQGNRNRNNQGGKKRGAAKKEKAAKVEPTDEEVSRQIRETLEKLEGKSNKSKGAKYRREKRQTHRQKSEAEQAIQEEQSKTLKVTEFVTVAEVATMMDVSSTKIISTCMSLGIMVTMNQRLDAETLTIVADEFGYEVEFVTAEIEEAIKIEEGNPEDEAHRAPIVTVMGHVDHGKTSLLDYIRKENVIAGESGGITQHIGAYGVELENGEKITFLDTPGHEAFTAMRARGAQVTDIAIIVIAADDEIMPQTKEAISHAQAANVPIIFAINKIDKPTANPNKIKELLASMNLMVEEWGGKIQSQDISAKTGIGINELLEKVLLEAEVMELKANPVVPGNGTTIEAFLDKGRGYVSTVLVQTGSLKIGDYVLAGKHSGKIKAMFDERGNRLKEAGPSTPASILGLDGAPQAGDKFYVFRDEKEAKQIASKRSQLQREQSVRTQKHLTLDEIGRRIALGNFKELNIIFKGDVDGSVEAITDSLVKLSTEEIQVKIIHKGVGAITESDVLLASASEAIVIGFNVRPTGNAKSIADKEEIDIRVYSVIYDAINDVKDAMEGMLSPEIKEEITGTAEIREVFKISKIGSIAGCMVQTGKIFRNSNIRLIRDNVVIFTGELASLKRFKDDVKEVSKGYDCGMQVKNYNDIKEGDVIEAFQEVAVKKKLK